MSDPTKITLVSYAFAQPGRQPQGRPFSGVVPTLVEDATEAATAKGTLEDKLDDARWRVELDTRGRRSRRRRRAVRSWRAEADRLERIAPSMSKTVCWKWVTIITLSDWVEDKLYDTIQVGRGRRRAR